MVKCDNFIHYDEQLMVETSQTTEVENISHVGLICVYVTDIPIQPTQYKLWAYICHEGQSMKVGHYTAYVSESDTWYKMDDHQVQYFALTLQSH